MEHFLWKWEMRNSEVEGVRRLLDLGMVIYCIDLSDFKPDPFSSILMAIFSLGGWVVPGQWK